MDDGHRRRRRDDRANLYQAMDETAATRSSPAARRTSWRGRWPTSSSTSVDMSRDLQDGRPVPRARRARRSRPTARCAWARCSPPSFTLSGSEIAAFRFDSKTAARELLRRERQVAARAVPPRAARVPPHLEHLRHARTIRSSAAGRRTRGRTTPRRPARRCARSAMAWSSGRAGRVATATCSNSAIATATLRAMDTCAGSPRGSAPERASRSARRSRTSARRGSARRRTSTSRCSSAACSATRAPRSAPSSGVPLAASERVAFERLREQLLASLDATPGVVRVALR